MRAGLLWLLLLSAVAVQAAPPSIAIILDDMGYDRSLGEAALALPAGVTYAFLPQAPHTQVLARQARQQGREIMLHLPMQAMSGRVMDAGGLHMDMSESQFRRTLQQQLAAVPDAVGVNNHMGSLLTRHPGAMAWLMRGLAERGHLYYVDSRTHRATVAEQQARETGLPVTRRDVFLDHEADPEFIRAQLAELVRLARHNGSAVGIGHPYADTIAVLARELPQLAPAGIELLPVSAIIDKQQRQRLWRASSSPSQTVAKSSKQSP
jgi:polysaccharide deacetylase 2 family uncharacterized protein YibQ